MMAKYFSVFFFVRTVSSLFHWVMWVIPTVLNGPKPHPLEKIAALAKSDCITIPNSTEKIEYVSNNYCCTLDSCELHLKLRESAINLVLFRRNQVYIRVNSGYMKIPSFITK